MNSSTVANLLGVSQSTLKRWIKELDLDVNRNELGHFDFNEEDITILKKIQKQIHNGTFLQDIVISKSKVRKGKTTTTETFLQKIDALEKRINEKADKVVSYQLLTHRKDIEELESEIKRLHEKIELLEEKLSVNGVDWQSDYPFKAMNIEVNQKHKKRNLLTMLFHS
ncbi:MerR family transcriptional regulator [Bacillus sp. FJAT-49736]|uniref:MerR family transcriptional regulator n=1 Tax=Bacillus sp. FJAT-49736 TaxID=2833582 RepID=UPI001BC9297E|nr:MerR family transcriptional regulator [Bacillus sp. FJAT-49736]MBS4175571.1 MerR family transcriptional regulator [Bacillus sp. FJAT-49736]